ncbi:LysR family transcriptional regulator [Polyangium sp. 15x6]|uniref:LysR family transcriptional regulator n=1 Tax=Polyangium sp. 15x6 TaxID=3042687 RepID=UPI00249A6CE8|nr:LysR family transcriptional regulator [Polyangium sp. 15x6]MDI3290824.1 LysR family transcriptional regulator [Polyangium sp. 15x6]
MTIIDHTHLARLDLNLLVAFDALLTERHVTRAAARLGLSQSAMSHNLARLRDLFGDELFVRAERGMRPTPRARELSAQVRSALAGIQATLQASAPFDPARDERHFRIAVYDDMEIALLPPLLAHLEALGSNVRIEIRPFAPADVPDMLDAAELDLAIGVLGEGRTHHKRRVICAGDTYLCLFDPHGHELPVPMTAKHYAEIPHVRISSRKDLEDGIDAALAKRRLKRRIALSTPHAVGVPYLLRRLRAVATLRRSVALAAAKTLDLSTAEVPITLPKSAISMVWHSSYDNGPAHRWLREEILRIAREL